ncbi:DUF3857 domain-containing protein [Flavobacterium sp.]|uniref:DUF3857 domain-containing protein n=1 Tax=Flavobacterium sp. TaxID=239 RepID=UPI002B4B6F22|nr:DUF3857 domain-containing protein [Flavobacterium sp.]HLP63756.1 DUF3857 domain-containing protein [Flavobacterium sp.]
MKNTFLKTILFFVFISMSTRLTAQDYTFKNYDWESKTGAVDIPEKYKNETEIILDRHIKVEINADGKEVAQFYLYHEKIYINSDDAIERNNRIYIPFNMNESVIETKARVILKNGKVIKLDKKDIKEEVDEERGLKLNYFALTGIEKGAIIEQLFVIREVPELDGKTIKMQEEYPILNSSFELVYPSFVNFKTKCYNGLSEPVIDEKKFDKKTLLTITEKEIPALHDDEKYANWNAHLKMFRYKLYENYNNGAKNIYNYKKFATNIYERFNGELDKKSQKAVDDFCKTIPTSNDPQEMIWNIENKIKKTIPYNRYFDTKETLAEVIKSKQANQSDILSLYIAVFRTLNIESNTVFTSNRYKSIFDGEFESYESLSDILFYFPAIDKYLCPTEIEYRIPLIPNYLANQDGLFIKPKEFGGVKMGIGEIKFIQIPGTDITHDVMEITVDFTQDLQNPIIKSKMSYGGYSGINFQPIKDFADADQYKEVLKNVAENYTSQKEYKSLTTENDGLDYVGKKPFIMNLEYEGKDLVQKAGDSYLFSVGKIIGAQMEFYQETKRVLPVEIDYPHSYFRTIKILLPEGVTVKNLEKFNLNFKMDVGGKTEAVFVSSYKSGKNEITVENTEYYKIMNYPLEQFEEYKAVINAAADFNKIVIILNK